MPLAKMPLPLPPPPPPPPLLHETETIITKGIDDL